MKVKNIEWSEHFPPNSGVTSYYDHIIGETPFGTFQLEWKSWKKYDSFTISLNGEYLESKYNLEDAKVFCYNWFSGKIMSCLED